MILGTLFDTLAPPVKAVEAVLEEKLRSGDRSAALAEQVVPKRQPRAPEQTTDEIWSERMARRAKERDPFWERRIALGDITKLTPEERETLDWYRTWSHR